MSGPHTHRVAPPSDDEHPAGGYDDTAHGSTAAVTAHSDAPATDVLGPPPPTHEADTDKVTAGTVAAASRHEFRTFVRWMLALTVVLVALVAAFNAYVDPFGVTPSDRYPPVVNNTTDRQAKLTLLERLDTAPDSLIFGSSRVMKLDPAYIRARTGTTAFNAGLSSATPQEAYVFASYAAERFDRFPHIVWGLDIEQFREKPVGDQANGVLLRQPGLRKHLPVEDRLEGLFEMYTPLVEWQTTKISVRVLREGDVEQRSEEEQIDRLIERQFTARGFRKRDRHDRAFERGAKLGPRLEQQVEGYARTVYEVPGFEELGETPRHWIEQTIALANRNGDQPTIFLTTLHPAGQERLGDSGWYERRDDVRAYFARLAGRYDFQLIDYTDLESFGGDPDNFYDGVHLRKENMQRLVDDMVRRGALPRGDADA